MTEPTVPARRVRAITFDLDFTLWDLEGVLHRAETLQYRYLAARYPEVARRYTAAGLQALRLRLYKERSDLRHDVTELRKAALRRVAAECGYDETMVAQAFQVFIDARHEVRLYDDVEPLLARLRGRYVIGVITNGNADVRRFGIGEHFDFVLSPMEIGAAKPDRVIFEAACHRAGVEPAEAVHVGDDPEADVVGAARYGMLPVWLNRTGAVWPQTLTRPACVELASLAELDRHLQHAQPPT
jgi:HAD superfamily hydrolase (TIGR01509 family)